MRHLECEGVCGIFESITLAGSYYTTTRQRQLALKQSVPVDTR